MAQPGAREVARYEVAGTPQTVGALLRDFFESEEWEWRRVSSIYGPTVIGPGVKVWIRPPLLLSTPLGFLAWAALSILTFGTFTALWFCWRAWMLLGGEGTREVRVKPTQVGTNTTRLVVEVSGRRSEQYAGPLTAFIERELVEKKAASFSVNPLSPS